ncbi:hypothetical protein HaLaN_11605 [Haematococcus lacustris]|uniref:Uncharacterized protein n=1 Tax=Haematococcus lacustris TaxID=44745 RepID=A0A699Z948_HAELA|nr:hypothetical protein HaLaN_11605 [Haematococcus lacustris]
MALLSLLTVYAAIVWTDERHDECDTLAAGAATSSCTPSRRELKQSASSGGLNQRAQEAGGRTLSEVKRVVSELCNSRSGVDGAAASLAAAVATATGQAYAQAATSQPSSGCGNVNEDARVLADAVAQALSSSFAGITNNCQAATSASTVDTFRGGIQSAISSAGQATCSSSPGYDAKAKAVRDAVTAWC